MTFEQYRELCALINEARMRVICDTKWVIVLRLTDREYDRLKKLTGWTDGQPESEVLDRNNAERKSKL